MSTNISEDPIRIFVSYARKDKRWFDADNQHTLIPWLIESLKKQNVAFWYDKELVASDVFTNRIQEEVNKARIAILMVSQPFLNSDYIEKYELPWIKQRAEQGKLSVVPVLVEPCSWEDDDFLSARQMLPGKPTPLIKYIADDARWADVKYELLDGIKKLVKRIREEQRLSGQKTQPQPQVHLPPQPANLKTSGEEPRPPFPWHYIHPDFQRELLERLAVEGGASTHLYFWSPSSEKGELGENPAGNVRPFLEAGCVTSVRYLSGKLSFNINVDALLATGPKQLIDEWLNTAKPRQEKARQRLFLLKKWLLPLELWPSSSDFNMQGVKHGLGPCLRAAILWRYYRNASAAKEQLAIETGVSEAKMLLAIDEGELEKFRNSLREAQELARDKWGIWIEIASSWKGLLDDDGLARSSLKQAERVSNYSLAWTLVAQAWKTVFNGEEEARRALAQAEAVAKDSLDWMLVAEAWKILFNGEKEARRALAQAEAVVKYIFDWTRVAKAWKQVFNGEKEARRVLAQAEAVAKSSLDWKFVADGWKTVFDDEKEARRALAQAEARAKGSLDWRWVADGWKELFDDEKEARRALAQAEAVAMAGFDWKHVADGWKKLFDDEKKARRALGQAEAVAKSNLDWRGIAESWKELFSDEKEARCALGKAEAAAKDSWDWQETARHWKQLFKDEEEARRCLAQAEATKSKG